MTLRTGLLLGTAFVVGLSAGPALRRIAPALHTAGLIGAAHADDAAEGPQDTYHLLTLFGEVFEKVRADYVAPVKGPRADRQRAERHGQLARPAQLLSGRQAVSRHASPPPAAPLAGSAWKSPRIAAW